MTMESGSPVNKAPASGSGERLRVLCVDDEPRVLEGLELRLRRSYELVAAFDGNSALLALQQQGPFAIVISDMRMPGMDGATLLAAVRRAAPDTVRLLLTGYADLDSAIAAVNNGQIFRFLSKPCPPEVLQRAMQDAETQYRLQRGERDLLERTLRGAVRALSDVLSLADPEAYGRASRVQRLALELAEHSELNPRWPLELAALLAPIGRVSLPTETVRRQQNHEELTSDEEAMLTRVPEVTDKLLATIPRLEGVREILRLSARTPTGTTIAGAQEDPELLMRAAHILRLANDYEEMESGGNSAAMALANLRGREELYDAALLHTLETLKGTEASRVVIRELPVRMLQPGMVLAQDLYTSTGMRVVSRGYEITTGFVEKIRNYRPGTMREPVRVVLRKPGEHGNAT